MPQARLSVRVDADTKDQAEEVLHQLGLNLSTGINAFLRCVVREQAIPFPLVAAAAKPAPVAEVEDRARAAVAWAREDLEASGAPLALYDKEQGRAYLLGPDGTRDYDL
jgi:DNA-damage-inducible protein J